MKHAQLPKVELPSSARAAVRAPAKRSKRTIKFLRRIHLYSGLVLVPWVLLYGVTGFLFNHPTAASDSLAFSVPHEQVAGSALLEPIDPEALANGVVAALEAQRELAAREDPEEGDVAPTVQRQAQTAAWIDNRFVIEAESSNKTRRHRLTVNPDTGSAQYREFAARRREPQVPFATDDLDLVERELDDWREAGQDLLNELAGSELQPARLRSGPDVLFPVVVDGERFVARYDLVEDELSGRPEDQSAELGMRSFLLRMHLARGYPQDPGQDGGVRLIWALFVDGMALSMVLWALTGLVMWWQIKKTRRVGIALLTLSPLAAAGIALGMYSALTS